MTPLTCPCRNCTYHNYNTRPIDIVKIFAFFEFGKKCVRYKLPEPINTTSTNNIKNCTNSFDSLCRYTKLSLLGKYTDVRIVDNCYVCHRLAAK